MLPSHFCRLQRSGAWPRLASCRSCTPLTLGLRALPAFPSGELVVHAVQTYQSSPFTRSLFSNSSLQTFKIIIVVIQPWVGSLCRQLYTMYMCFQAAPMGQTCFPAKNNLSPWKQGTGQEATPPFPFSYFWTHISPFRNLTCFGGVHLLHLLGRYLPVTKILKSSICPQSWLHYTNASDIQTLNFDLTKVRYI